MIMPNNSEKKNRISVALTRLEETLKGLKCTTHHSSLRGQVF